MNVVGTETKFLKEWVGKMTTITRPKFVLFYNEDEVDGSDTLIGIMSNISKQETKMDGERHSEGDILKIMQWNFNTNKYDILFIMIRGSAGQ